MTGDQTVERAADTLQRFASQLAGEGGLKAKVAESLADDANLIRKMKPSLIKARAKGEAPANQKPGQGTLARSSPKRKRSGGGVGPLIVVGAALAAGIVLAKWIDWRGHGHSGD
jgi:hypothetical protein